MSSRTLSPQTQPTHVVHTRRFAPVQHRPVDTHSCDAFRPLDPIGLNLFGYNIDIGQMTMGAIRNFPYISQLIDMGWRILRMKEESKIAVALQTKLFHRQLKGSNEDQQVYEKLSASIKQWNAVHSLLLNWEPQIKTLRCMFQKTEDCAAPARSFDFEAHKSEQAQKTSLIQSAQGLIKKILQSPVVAVVQFFFGGGAIEMTMIQNIRAAMQFLGRDVIPFNSQLSQSINTNKDGVISSDELNKYLRKVGPVQPDLLRKIDQNGDQTIQQDELDTYIRKVLDKYVREKENVDEFHDARSAPLQEE